MALLKPALSRIMAAIGLSVVSITGMDAILTQIRQQLVTGIGGMPSDIFNLFLLAGGGQALGILTGALTTRLLLWNIQRATQILGVNPA